MKKKIFFIVTGLQVGGAEKFLISLVNSIDKEKFESIVISLSNERALREELGSDVQFIALPRKRKFDLLPLFNLRELLKKEQPEKLFFIGLFPFFIAMCAGILIKHRPKIISYHTTIPLNKKEDNLHKLYFRFVSKKDIIITVSKNQEIYTAERYHLSRKLFTTIHNGVDVSHWKPQPKDFSRREFRGRYNLPEDSKVIIVAATLRPEKNHIAALKALNILHKKHDLKAYLLVVGDGKMLNELKRLTEELDLNDYVKFLGYQRDVRPYYWISDLFTLCSDKVETFSIAALEAMACGLPVVLTDIGGANEMVHEDINGLMCLPNEEDISKKWDEALSRNFDASRIVQFVENDFDQKEMIRKYENLLDNRQ